MAYGISSILTKLPENNRFERIWKLAQVDFKKRYYNDRLGLLWALINPILKVLIYWIVFSYIMEKVRAGIPNFALFIFSAIIFWMCFVEMMRKGMRVLEHKRYLIENIRVQKEDLYISNSLSILMGFSFNLIAYLIIAYLFGVRYSGSMVFLPIIVLTTALIGTGTGMILSVIFIFFRDINHLVDIIVLFGFWTSGIFFPSSQIIAFWKPLYYLNPFVGILENVRSIIVYGTNINLQIMSINLIISLVIFAIGLTLVKQYSHMAIERL